LELSSRPIIGGKGEKGNLGAREEIKHLVMQSSADLV
jgi:hypothetical protein